MREDLIERLRKSAAHLRSTSRGGLEYEARLQEEAAAALEAAREVFYVVDVSRGGDANVIPVSMFDDPAIFPTEAKAERFRDFANGTGRPHVVRKLTLAAIDQARGKGGAGNGN